jgi:uncharacterized protein (TIGR02270 family)
MRLPDFLDQDATRSFSTGLYQEHLEETSFLYEQRVGLYHDPEVTWLEIGEFEERLEAHIVGLIVGDKLALDFCKTRAAEGDFGELYATVCVFCRQGQRDLVLAALDQLDPADAGKAGAVADALKYELPDAWFQDFLTLLASGDPKLAPILARAFGYRRLPCGPQLLSAVRHCATPALPGLIWTLGRIAYEPAKGPLLDYLRSEEEPVRAAAAMALARIGEPSVIDYCLGEAPSKSWAILPLGLAGGRATLGPLTELSKKNSTEGIIALGLLGDPVSVPLLISRLEQEEAGAHAAMALQCLTGACLCETVFVPDEVDEDELFESERERVKQGKTLDRGDGRPFGSNITRLSQSQDAWTNWWGANQDRFTPGTRYRNGGKFSPERLVETLTSERTPHRLRQYCCEELAIRYGNDFGLETDMPVRSQIPRLAEATAWSRSGATRFEEAAWYFGGYGT